ncbi:hypothetical protein JCM10212_002424 [Sporobolomyces blumeae]
MAGPATRPPHLDLSALSPEEYDAYAPLVHSVQEEYLGKPDPAQVWTWLKPAIDERELPKDDTSLLALFRKPSSQDALGTALALLRLCSHSRRNTHLTRDHLFIQAEPVTVRLSASSVPSPTAVSPVRSNPFLARDVTYARTTTVSTPPSSLTASPVSSRSPHGPAASKPSNPFRPPSSSTSSPPSSLPTSPTSLFPSSSGSTIVPRQVTDERESRRKHPPLPPRRPTSDLGDADLLSRTDRHASASSALREAAVTHDAPPLPIRRAVSLSHPPSFATGTPVDRSRADPSGTAPSLARAQTVHARPSPSGPKPPRPAKPARFSTANSHIGLDSTPCVLDVRRQASTSPVPRLSSGGGTTGHPDPAAVAEPRGTRSRKGSLVGTAARNRSRSGSLTSSAASTSAPSYTYTSVVAPSSPSRKLTSTLVPAPTPPPPPPRAVASSALVGESSTVASDTTRRKASAFEGFSTASIVLPLPPRPSERATAARATVPRPEEQPASSSAPRPPPPPPPPPCHPNRRKAALDPPPTPRPRRCPSRDGPAKTLKPTTGFYESVVRASRRVGLDGFKSTWDGVAAGVGPPGSRSSEDRERGEERERLVERARDRTGGPDDDQGELGPDSDDGDGGDQDEAFARRDRSDSSSCSSYGDRGAGSESGGLGADPAARSRRDRRTEVEREARRRDEAGQWVQL